MLEQVISDFSDIVTDLKDDKNKKNLETKNVLNNIQKQAGTARKQSPQSTTTKPPVQNPTESSTPFATASSPASSSAKSSTKGPEFVHTSKQAKTEYQCKARVLLVGDSLAQNSDFRKLEAVTNTTIKTAKAYSSIWDNAARYKDKNVTKVVKDELMDASFDHLVLAAPTVDITNLDTSEFYKQKIGNSC